MKETVNPYLLKNIDDVVAKLSHQRLADVFRFTSFIPFEIYPKHQHKRIEVNYVKKGSCIIHLENKSVVFNENDLMIIASCINHSFEAGVNGCALMQLEFSTEVFGELNVHSIFEDKNASFDIFSKENRILKIVDNERIMRAVQCIVFELHSKNCYYRHLVLMYYTEFLLLVYRYFNEKYLPLATNTVLRNSIEFIRSNYEKELNVKDIADTIGVTDRYLRKLFATHLNLSPIEYINQVRINKAVELLRLSEHSIKEVCYLCGFQSPHYFSRFFRKQTGISPSEVMKL